MKDFETDNQEMSENWAKETAKDTELRLLELEKKFESSHNRLVLEIRSWSADLIKMLPPPIASNMPLPVHSTFLPTPQPYSTIASTNLTVPSFANPASAIDKANYNIAFPSLNQSARPRLGSNNKRARLEDSAKKISTPAQPHQGKKSEPVRNKGIVGTGNSAVSGRRMRSLPADIFVWGYTEKQLLMILLMI